MTTSALFLEQLGELTTVATRHAVIHEGVEVRVIDGLEPDTEHEIDGHSFRTLPERGELLATFATVNDVHFGEEVCGLMDGHDAGPVLSSAPGEPPYPDTMNEAAVAEILDLDPASVVVKGDLTADGTDEQVDRFLEVYAPVADRLTWVRGNHESYNGQQRGAVPIQEIVLPGVRVAVLDTSVEGSESGHVTDEQIAWLDDLAADADRPVVVMGHHHPWNPSAEERPDHYFGINPDASEALVSVVARRPAIVGYFAGHTHRNRVRHFAATGEVPWVEVASVKDFPGAWAEYRVHEGAILQVFHRISSPAALEWTERTRQMFSGLYGTYAFGGLDDRCFAMLIDRRASR